jgi:hypothetical protein
MNFHGFDVTITSVKPSPRDNVFDVEFLLGNDPNEYEFIYWPNEPEESWFSDFPDDFSSIQCPKGYLNCVEKDFNKLVKNYLLKKTLTPKTQQTFNDLIDEL